ncbi:MAG TPA: hypothetical protein VM942_05400 [Acidimicrobiales bacterium]|nr:hypothetical protein [Acidimicrobiales bacterium]
MESAECAARFGQAAAGVCQRLAEMGWDPAMGAGWFSGLSAIIAGFVFSAIVLLLTPGSPFRRSSGYQVEPGHALPVLLGSFLSLLSASFLFILAASQHHPLKVGPSAVLAAAVFGAGAVQTFVAISWLSAASPLTPFASGCFSFAARFVMLSTGLHVLVTVIKSQWIVTGGSLGAARVAAYAFLLVGPWLAVRTLVHPHSISSRRTGRLQMASLKLSVSFVALASTGVVFAVDRGNISPAASFPDWMAIATLLGLGLIYSLHELNLPVPAMLPGLEEEHARGGHDGLGADELAIPILPGARRRALVSL